MIEVSVEADCPEVSAATIEEVLEAVLEAEGASRDLSVVVVDDERIHGINRDFLDHDYPTDVLAFDLDDPGPGMDGEIVVSIDHARSEAGGDVELIRAELLLYCVHGLLHLLGYDDHAPAERRAMHLRQRELLLEMGYETRQI